MNDDPRATIPADLLRAIVLAVVRMYEQAPQGEGLDGALWRGEIAARAVLAGASEDEAVAAGLAPKGYGVPPYQWEWVRRPKA